MSFSLPDSAGVPSAITAHTAVVEYDETVTDVEALRAKVIDCGFYCSGEALPRHICKTQTGGAQEIGHDAKKTTRR